MTPPGNPNPSPSIPSSDSPPPGGEWAVTDGETCGVLDECGNPVHLMHGLARPIAESYARCVNASRASLSRQLAEARKVAYDVPLCADHAQTWFTARHFKEGDCWFCQKNAELAELQAVVEKHRRFLEMHPFEHSETCRSLLADDSDEPYCDCDQGDYIEGLRDLLDIALKPSPSVTQREKSKDLGEKEA